MTRDAAKEFCERWLPAWQGNQPETLLSFYADNAFYSDPLIREGVTGREALFNYFKKLLHHNPEWTWTHLEAFPFEDGFLNKWLARIPTGAKIIACIGVCTVQFDDAGLIRRNEVYFDRSEILVARHNP